ncbi:MAG: ATP-binding protein [Deltaproteobacteria bacterium]
MKERELLYGRDRQVERTLESLDTPGRSVFMFGERGVGKTSLAQTSAYLFNSSDSDPILISCHPTISFPRLVSQIARRLLGLPIYSTRRLRHTTEAKASAFGASLLHRIETEPGNVPHEIDVNDAVDLLNEIASRAPASERTVVVVDELDRVQSTDVRRDIAFLLKQLGDRDCPIKFIFVGIGDTVDELLDHHESASRYMATIKLERLPLDAIHDILVQGVARLGFSMSRDIAFRIACISDGFAHYAHLIGLKTVIRKLLRESDADPKIGVQDYEAGLIDAIEDSEAWLKSAYDNAVQKYKDRYEPVLWSVADHWELERSTEHMYPAYVRICSDLEVEALPRKKFSFALNQLKKAAHGPALISSRRSWYRFRHSLLRGYSKMCANARGVSVGLNYLESRAEWRPDSERDGAKRT